MESEAWETKSRLAMIPSRSPALEPGRAPSRGLREAHRPQSQTPALVIYLPLPLQPGSTCRHEGEGLLQKQTGLVKE